MKVKASKIRSVPSQMCLHARWSMSGWKWSAKASRTRLFTPSAATIRSASPASAALRSSRSNTSRTPSSAARSWRMLRKRLRPMPQNPCPPELIVRPRKTTSMSCQWARLSMIRCFDRWSAPARFWSVWSENTTPQPKVSPGRLRS